MSTATAPSAIGAMTLEAVAAELGCDELRVQRLIARGHLVAVQVGHSPRVMASAAAAYVAAGAKDFIPPDITGHGWFLDEEERYAEKFREAIIKAATSALPSPEQLKKRWEETIAEYEKQLRVSKTPYARPGGISGTLKPSAAVAQIIATLPAKIPGTAFDPRGPKRFEKFRTWAELYLVHRLRVTALRMVNKNVNLRPLAALYESRETYLRVRTEALATLMADAIQFRDRFLVEPEKAGGYRIDVEYSISHRELTTDPERLPALAF